MVSYRNDEVKLNAATPAPGFSVDVDKAGPPEVRVDFEGLVTTVEVRVRSDSGILDIEVKQDS